MGTDQMYEQYQQNRTKWMYKSLLRWRFFQAAHLNWQRNHAPVPAHLLQLKKPLLPDRWDGPRNGWNLPPKFKWPDWMENLLSPGLQGVEQLKEELLRKRPTPNSELYFDEARMVVGWRVPPEVEG